jgi:hydrogenase maturation factor
LLLADSGKTIFHPAADANDRTFTIPAESSVNYAVGTVVTFINLSANDLTIAITTDTMYLAGDGSTTSRTLAQYGVASAVKVAGTTPVWVISGNGLT